MSTHYVAVRDTAVKLPEGDYFGRLYLPEDPPDDFRAPFDFHIPDDVHIDHDARCIVAFMIDPTEDADMPYKVRLNDVEIRSRHPVGGVARGMWEIVSGDLLLQGDNTIEFWALPNHDSRGYLYFSDVVIWYKST